MSDKPPSRPRLAVVDGDGQSAFKQNLEDYREWIKKEARRKLETILEENVSCIVFCIEWEDANDPERVQVPNIDAAGKEIIRRLVIEPSGLRDDD